MKRVGSTSSSLCSQAGAVAPVTRILSGSGVLQSSGYHHPSHGGGGTPMGSTHSSPTSYGCPLYPTSSSPCTAAVPGGGGVMQHRRHSSSSNLLAPSHRRVTGSNTHSPMSDGMHTTCVSSPVVSPHREPIPFPRGGTLRPHLDTSSSFPYPPPGIDLFSPADVAPLSSSSFVLSSGGSAPANTKQQRRWAATGGGGDVPTEEHDANDFRQHDGSHDLGDVAEESMAGVAEGGAEDDDLDALGECPEEEFENAFAENVPNHTVENAEVAVALDKSRSTPQRDIKVNPEFGSVIHHSPDERVVVMTNCQVNFAIHDEARDDLEVDNTAMYTTLPPVPKRPSSSSTSQPTTSSSMSTNNINKNNNSRKSVRGDLDEATIRTLTSVAHVDDKGAVPTDMDEYYFNPFSFRSSPVGAKYEFFDEMGFGLRAGPRNSRAVYVRDPAKLTKFAEQFREQFPESVLGIPRAQQWKPKKKIGRPRRNKKDDADAKVDPPHVPLPYLKGFERNLYRAFHPNITHIPSVVTQFLERTYTKRFEDTTSHVAGTEYQFYKSNSPSIAQIVHELSGLTLTEQHQPPQEVESAAAATSSPRLSSQFGCEGHTIINMQLADEKEWREKALQKSKVNVPSLERQGNDVMTGFFKNRVRQQQEQEGASTTTTSTTTHPVTTTAEPLVGTAKSFYEKYGHMLTVQQRKKLQYVLFKDDYEDQVKRTNTQSPSSTTGQDHVELTNHQVMAIELASKGYNLFIGGSAGTGKSVLLKVLRRVFTRKLNLRVLMTATTGIAASSLGGATVFAALQINPITLMFADMNLLTAYDVIVIDECGFLTSDFLQNLDEKLRLAHGASPLPFGGVQIILCGDFLQLESPKKSETELPLIHSKEFRENFIMFKLTEVVRQSDPVFVEMLRQVRRGNMPKELLEKICIVPSEKSIDTTPIRLDLHALQPQSTYSRLVETGQSEQAEHDKAALMEIIMRDPMRHVDAEREFGYRRRNLHFDDDGQTSLTELEEKNTKVAESRFTSDILQEVKTQQHESFLLHSNKAFAYVPGAINLLPTNRQTRAANMEELAQLPGDTITFPPFVGLPTLRYPGLWSDVHFIKVDINYFRFNEVPYVDTPKVDGKDTSPSSWVDMAEVAMTLLNFVKREVHQLRISDICTFWLNDDTLAMRIQVPYKFVDDVSACREVLNAEMLKLPTMVAIASLRNGNAGRSTKFLVEPSTTTTTTKEGDVGKDDEARVEIEQSREMLQANMFEGVDMSALKGFSYAGSVPCNSQAYSSADFDMLEARVSSTYFGTPLQLKVGAKVMIRANLTQNVVNGTVGTVIGFQPASTINSQSEPLREYLQFAEIELGIKDMPMPIVQFANGITQTICPTSASVGGKPDTNFLIKKSLIIPLTLAYAFTVHKVQGMTLLGRVHVSLMGLWGCLHYIYVAFSRVRNINQLSVVGFTERMLTVDDDCLLFDESLPTPDQVFIPPESTVSTWKRFPSQRRTAMEANRVLKAKNRSQYNAAKKLLALSSGEGEASTTPTPSPFAKPFFTTDGTSTTQHHHLPLSPSATDSTGDNSKASDDVNTATPPSLEPLPVEVENVLLNATHMKLVSDIDFGEDPRVQPRPPAPDEDSYYSATLSSWIPKSSSRRKEARARMAARAESIANIEDDEALAKGRKAEEHLLATGALTPEAVKVARDLDETAAMILKERRKALEEAIDDEEVDEEITTTKSVRTQEKQEKQNQPSQHQPSSASS